MWGDVSWCKCIYKQALTHSIVRARVEWQPAGTALRAAATGLRAAARASAIVERELLPRRNVAVAEEGEAWYKRANPHNLCHQIRLARMVNVPADIAFECGVDDRPQRPLWTANVLDR